MNDARICESVCVCMFDGGGDGPLSDADGTWEGGSLDMRVLCLQRCISYIPINRLFRSSKCHPYGTVHFHGLKLPTKDRVKGIG